MSADVQIWSIKEINHYIRMKMETDACLQQIGLRGEISNFTHHSSGHMYFTLKDTTSRIRAIMFASYNQKLSFRPQEGTKVIARGNITVYERDGQYQFYVQHMHPDGIGTLFMAFEQLKERLQQEGLFAQEHKRPLPQFPVTIGVITSPTGAAVQDILITLQRRQPNIHVLLYPVLVQGMQAAASIVQAIEAMNRQQAVDVLIVGRGGGSMEELWAFNEEMVVRAIAASTIPIISAVGHETDFTLADFAADLRAPTPTAAAELAVKHQDEIRSQLTHLRRRLQASMNRCLQEHQQRLLRIQQAVAFRRPKQWLSKQTDRLVQITEQLSYRLQIKHRHCIHKWKELDASLRLQTPLHRIQMWNKQLIHINEQFISALMLISKQKRAQLTTYVRQLDALSPLKMMARGYSVVYDETETKRIRTINEVQLGDVIRVTVTDGQLACHVWAMKEGINNRDGKSGNGATGKF